MSWTIAYRDVHGASQMQPMRQSHHLHDLSVAKIVAMLDLSLRSKNVLLNSVMSTDELLHLSRSDILSFRNAGATTAYEITIALEKLRQEHGVQVGLGVTELRRERLSLRDLVNRLSLSARARNVLINSGIHPDDILGLGREHILMFKNAGMKTADEIMVAIERVRGEVPNKTGEEGSLEPVETLFVGEAKSVIDCIKTKLNPTVQNSLLEDLGLVAVSNILKPLGVCSFDDLLQMPHAIARNAGLSPSAWTDVDRVLRARGVESECGLVLAGTAGDVPGSLDEELWMMTASERRKRNRALVARYWGWDGGRGATLEEIGAALSLSRQRVNDIVRRCEAGLRSSATRARPWPFLSIALSELELVTPCSAQQAELTLVRLGVTRKVISIEGIFRAAQFLERAHSLTLDQGPERLLLHVGAQEVPALIRGESRRSIRNHGAASVEEVEKAVGAKHPNHMVDADFVRTVMEATPGFAWLDSSRDWCGSVNPAGRTDRIANLIRKVLSVAGEIDADDLHRQLARHSELSSTMPPKRIILEICRQMPRIVVEGRRIRSRVPLDAKKELRGAERFFYEFVLLRQSVVDLNEVTDELVSRGLSTVTATIMLCHSPIVKRFKQNQYGLVGQLPGGDLIFAQHATRRRRKTEFEWTPAGTLRLRIPLDDTLRRVGVFSVPTSVRRFLKDSFSLFDERGNQCGTLRVNPEGSAWGIKPFLGKQGGVGSALSLDFDLVEKRVAATIV